MKDSKSEFHVFLWILMAMVAVFVGLSVIGGKKEEVESVRQELKVRLTDGSTAVISCEIGGSTCRLKEIIPSDDIREPMVIRP